MEQQEHFRRLERMYAAAPINAIYEPSIEVREGEAEIEMELSERFHHAAGAVHGSVYFKMLDDAAFFAANSLEQRVFVLTVSFTTYLTRPVVSGTFRAVGRVVFKSKKQTIAESVVYDAEGNEAGRGNGIFLPGKWPLRDALGYSE
jgi:uncharacterized protein (TIGR00369 family)